jgi:adenylate cyclase
MNFRKFISELNRRNVIKSTIAYLAVAWVFIEIASTVLPAFNAPDYAIKIIIYLLLVGLIFWVGFSWIYDWTPDGLQKTDDTIDDEETMRLNNRRLNKVIAGTLTLAVILLIVISFYAGASWNDSPILQISKKVAVIPFEHEVEDTEEDYFKTGMTQELINELSKVDELTVISQATTKVLYANIGPANILISNELKQIDYFVYGTIERQLNKLNIHLNSKNLQMLNPSGKKAILKILVM